MSVTGHNDVRRLNDFYETPAWCTKAILPMLPSVNILDPCAGTGAILRAVRDEHPDAQMYGYELDPKLANISRQEHGLSVITHDSLSVADWLDADVYLFNPPFVHSLEFVQRALAEATKSTWVVALLRLNWLAGIKRMGFHRVHPADVYVLPKRPSFTGDGKTDATEYAWFVWRRFAGGRWMILDLPRE